MSCRTSTPHGLQAAHILRLREIHSLLMSNLGAETCDLLPTTATWQLWGSSSDLALPLPRSVDVALAGYTFYPESDWAVFGYRPPEDRPVEGAWRDAGGETFIFLLGDATPRSRSAELRYLLHVSGQRWRVDEIERKIATLKSGLERSERRDMQVKHADQRLQQEKVSPAVPSLIKLVGLFTLLVNAFSLGLRQLSPIQFPSPLVQDFYQGLLAVVHVAALLLLLIITVIGVIYAVRYGILMVRRL